MTKLEALLSLRLAPAFEAVAGVPAPPVVRRSEHADFQADGAMALSRTLRRGPRDIAVDIAQRADLDDVCASVDVSGPGFINLTVADAVLGRLLAAAIHDERLDTPSASRPETVIVDYSAPNAAKEMHVGHLRSTIIGDATVRLLEWLGHTVTRENHIGDWGTPFGMLVEHLLDVGEAEAAHELSVGDLDRFYKAARAKFDGNAEFKDRSRRRVVLLQSGDETTGRLWELLVTESKKYFMAVYRRLGVRLTEADFVGESHYNDELASIVDELAQRGLLRDSEGAQCVFPEGFTNRDGEPLPIIVRKSDGGFGYGATDLSTIRDRTMRQRATRLVYVVGLPQSQHLAMVFEAAREAGWLRPPGRAQHVGFGYIQGPDRRPLRSRSGASIKLVDLLDEAVARAGDLVDARSPELDATARRAVASAVGIGAVKYADLSTQPSRDYVFDYDRMLSFDGNTAPYLQYAHARICSIFSRAGIEPPRDVANVSVAEPVERKLAIELLSFGGVLEDVAESLEFHRLANYLYGLATSFTAFYERCPVLRAEPAVRESRLALCDLTARTLALGLDLLGIAAPSRM
jgi:arginyl-tRNA synthetase